jgi:hypothetical protein
MTGLADMLITGGLIGLVTGALMMITVLAFLLLSRHKRS